jgi:hypothetical protein
MSNLAGVSGIFVSGLLCCVLSFGMRVSFHLLRALLTISIVDIVSSHSAQYIIFPLTSSYNSLCLARLKSTSFFVFDKSVSCFKSCFVVFVKQAIPYILVNFFYPYLPMSMESFTALFFICPCKCYYRTQYAFSFRCLCFSVPLKQAL